MPRAANKKHLRYHGVSARTLRAYKQAVNRFFLFCPATFGELPPSFEQLDYQLSEFINELFQEGDTLSLAGWTISGLKRFFPRCKPQLLTAQQLYKNWCRSHVPQRALFLVDGKSNGWSRGSGGTLGFGHFALLGIFLFLAYFGGKAWRDVATGGKACARLYFAWNYRHCACRDQIYWFYSFKSLGA